MRERTHISFVGRSDSKHAGGDTVSSGKYIEAGQGFGAATARDHAADKGSWPQVIPVNPSAVPAPDKVIPE